MGPKQRWPARAYDRPFLRASALHPGAGRTHRFGSAAIPGQLSHSSRLQRTWAADEPGRKGRPLPETDRRDSTAGLRAGREAVSWLAENSSALLPEPGRAEQMAGAVASADDRAAWP